MATILVALVATSALGLGSSEAAFPGGNGRIVYVTTANEGSALVTRTPSGGGRTVLRRTSDEGCVGNPAWRPDGGSLALDGCPVQVANSFGFDERLSGLATMRGDGSGFLRLPLVSQAEGPGVYYASDSQPAWSPDGGRLAFVSETRYDDGFLSYSSRRLAVMNADGSEPRALPDARIDDPERTNPEWSSRGLIAFTRWPGWAPCEERACDGRLRAAPAIWIIRPDGSGLRRVVARAQQPAWSPDGRRIVFVRSPGGLTLPETRIYVTGLEGEGVRTVARGFYPAWSPNGKRIAFVQSRPRRDHWRFSHAIYTVRLDGSDRRLVARSSRHDLGPLDWQPVREGDE
jgi:Tol biopolymer transport system component